MTDQTFREIAPPFMDLLIDDFPQLGRLDAAAVFGNFGHESAGFTKLQEISPTVPGSRGGYGWPQWTGPRRRAYEAYCLRNGKDPAAPASNYAYVFVELSGPEKRALDALVAARTLTDKVKAFELAYERAGIKHHASRNQWALIALEAYDAWKQAQNDDEDGEGNDTPIPGETLPGASLPEAATIEAITALASRTPEQLAAAARAIALAQAIQDGWTIGDPPAARRSPGITFTQPQESDMDGFKIWFRSKGVMGGLTALAALIGPVLGLDLGQTNINDATVAITDLIAAIGALVAIWGRVTARSQIAGGVTGKG